MRAIEDFMNRLTDMDWGWWPVLHFRPAKDENIDNKVLIKITPIFGTFLALFILFTSTQNTLISVLTTVLVSWIAFFAAYKLTFAIAWNARASRLREQNHKNN
jgi:hypothetical protein